MYSFKDYWNKCRIALSKCPRALLQKLMKWVKLLIIYSDIILGKRIDELEGSIGELMQEMDAGQEDASNPPSH